MKIWAHRGCNQMYPERPTGTRLDLEEWERLGITDVFLNEAERYLGEGGG